MGFNSQIYEQKNKNQQQKELQLDLEKSIQNLNEISCGLKQILLKGVDSLLKWQNLRDVEIIIQFRNILKKKQYDEQQNISSVSDNRILNYLVEQNEKQKKFIKIIDKIYQLYIDQSISMRNQEEQLIDSQIEEASILQQIDSLIQSEIIENHITPLSDLINQTQLLRLQRLRLSLFHFRLTRTRIVLNFFDSLNLQN